MTSDGPVVALVGPTAAGKSRLAESAAGRIDAEIVAVDAFTVYRGMDVGTAKPSPTERARVPHHMIDVLDPAQECTVGWFQRAARQAIADVHSRGRTALLVGGSGLYFRAVVDPLEFPPTDPAVRREVERRFPDPSAAHDTLRVIDRSSAERIDPGNLRRIVRAIEVYELTGRPFSEWRRGWEGYRSVYDELTVVGVDMDRTVLADRIAERVARMLAGGLVEEARALRGRPLSTTARQAIGYTEMWRYLDGLITLDDAAEEIRSRTRRYAVRQQRWFLGDPRVRWETPADVLDALIDGREC